MQLCSLNALGSGDEKKNDIGYIKPPGNSPSLPAAAAVKSDKPVAEVTRGEKISHSQPVQKPIPVTENTGTATIRKPLIKTVTPSINQHLQGDKKNDKAQENGVEQVNLNQPKTPFTQQQLEAVWDRYANNLKERGKTNLAMQLLSRKPVLTANSVVEFTITNKALEESINEDKMTFLGHLRRELNNYDLQLTLVMSAAEEKANLYTAVDRYKRLAEKNPLIHKFRQQFDLDVEF
jgi:DNA polymerase-3 subunit gamma/tau